MLGGLEVLLKQFLTSALDRGERSASLSGHFAAGACQIAGWMGPSLVTVLWRREESLVYCQKLKSLSLLSDL